MEIIATKNGYQIERLLHFKCNVYLVRREGHNILVDTTWKRERAILDGALKERGINTLDVIILTHSHYDHTGNAAFIKRKYGGALYIHASEAEYIRKGKMPKVKGTTPFGKTIAAFIAPLLVGRFRYDPVEPDVLVEDELLLSEYGNELRLIHTPGHTSGSISLIIDDEIALVGDSMIGLLPDRILPPYGDDEKQIRHSWRVLLDTGCSLFLPSHGSAVPKEVLLKNYINCFQ